MINVVRTASAPSIILYLAHHCILANLLTLSPLVYLFLLYFSLICHPKSPEQAWSAEMAVFHRQ